VQAHPHLEVLGRHVQRLLRGHDVRRHQQQPAAVLVTAERVVLAEHPAAEEREHHAGLDAGTAREHAAHRAAGADRQRAVGQRGEALRRGLHPTAAVHDVARVQRQVPAETGQLTHVRLGQAGRVTQLRDGAFGLLDRHHGARLDEPLRGGHGNTPVDRVSGGRVLGRAGRRAHVIDAT
jgi:hypothetical protein